MGGSSSRTVRSIHDELSKNCPDRDGTYFATKVQDVYGYNSLQVGLIFMGAEVPTLFGAFVELECGVPAEESNGRVSSPFCYQFHGGS